MSQARVRAKVRALRSVELGFSDLDQALRFFTEAWHLTHVGENGGVHYLRATAAFHHIVTLRRAAGASVRADRWRRGHE